MSVRDLAYWRSRCRVTGDDVKHAGATDTLLVRWLVRQGWFKSGRERSRRFGAGVGYATALTMWRPVPADGRGVSVPDTDAPEDVADAVRTMAQHTGRDAWAILDEIASAPPKGGE